MDATAMNIAMSALGTANLSTITGGQSGTTTGDSTFATLLGSLLGGNTTASGLFGSTDALGGGLFGSTDLFSLLGGTSLDDLQTQMLLEAMGKLADAEKPLVTDPVLARLMEQLKGMGGEDGEAGIEQLLAEMKKRLLEMAQQNGAEMAGGQAIALFAALMQDLTGTTLNSETLKAVSSDGGANLLQLMTQGDAKDLTALLKSAAQTGGSVQVETTTRDTAAQTAQTQAGGTAQTAQATPAYRPDFQTAVRQVINRMEQADGKKAGQAEELDVEALQQRVDSGVYLRGTALEGGLGTAQATQQPAPVEAQLYDALTAGVQAGQEEIVVKLAPEELGEVTIRLIKSDEGMKLSIIAKNPETQQMLQNQIESLQQRMQPYKVDVDSILTERQYEMLSHQQSFDSERRQNWTRSRMTYYGGSGEADEAEAVQAPPGMARVHTTGLDTYI